MFFFSSRRRHTRSLCDWSSDVCSSDLVETCSKSFPPNCGWPGEKAISRFEVREFPTLAQRGRNEKDFESQPGGLPCVERKSRSEERRVGKECRFRWEADREQKRLCTMD